MTTGMASGTALSLSVSWRTAVAVKVGYFHGGVAAGAEVEDADGIAEGVILAEGQGVHGVQPDTGQRVFTATFAVADDSSLKGNCGDALADVLGLAAECDKDCKDTFDWDKPLDCVPGGKDCPELTLTADVPDECDDGTRSVTFTVVLAPFPGGATASIDFGDGSGSEDVPLQSVLIQDVTFGQASVTHDYAPPASGTQTVTATVTLGDAGECNGVTATVDVPIATCGPTADCELSLGAADPDPCQGGDRLVTFSVVLAPAVAGDAVTLDFGDGSADEEVALLVAPFGDTTIGQGSTSHSFAAPAAGAITRTVVATVGAGSPCAGTTATVQVVVEACPPPPADCPASVDIRVLDPNGEDVTGEAQEGCLSPGRYELVAEVEPAGTATAFRWSVDGAPAVVGQRDVVAVAGARLAIELATAFRSVSVIVEGGQDCDPRSDGVDLDPCVPPCCPDVTALTATCMDPCGDSTTVTLTATGTDVECAEVFAWQFGDGQQEETSAPTVTHTYPQQGRFDATVTVVRPAACGNPRTQQRAAIVTRCPRPGHCVWLAILTGFLLLALLSLLPIIACASDPTTRLVLIVTLIVVAALLALFWLWWLLDKCCAPTRCELLRILYWVVSWALVVVGALAIGTFCISALPFGLFYVIIQQVIQRQINENNCVPGAPDIFSWPFGDEG